MIKNFNSTEWSWKLLKKAIEPAICNNFTTNSIVIEKEGISACYYNVILWYHKNQNPKFYCQRKVTIKDCSTIIAVKKEERNDPK